MISLPIPLKTKHQVHAIFLYIYDTGLTLVSLKIHNITKLYEVYISTGQGTILAIHTSY